VEMTTRNGMGAETERAEISLLKRDGLVRHATRLIMSSFGE
jgi:hypothetical protein